MNRWGMTKWEDMPPYKSCRYEMVYVNINFLHTERQVVIMITIYFWKGNYFQGIGGVEFLMGWCGVVWVRGTDAGPHTV